mmetsp:Transcript_23391/g.35228  ORF Transcript_23391/g.35228 Transcript_23391/m.35228 type:complete len:352 (+) Transcript_23391:76-1131(+)
MSSYITWTLTEIVLPLPLGVIISAITERLVRRSRPYARLRNNVIKLSVACMGVSCVSCNLLFLVGVIFGTAMQPVGLTGGIATGKSTVSSLLQRQSSSDKEDEDEFVIIDVDGIAHDILLPNKLGSDSVYNLLVAEFGKGILSTEEKGTISPNIDRRKLGDIVFRDVQKRRKLNSITHPKIIKIMLKRILLEGLNLNSSPSGKTTKRRRRRVVCVDIPLLFEGGLPMRLLFGTIIVVACKPDLQLERLHKRNPDLTLEQCRQRIASQIPVEKKAAKAHVVIRNDEDLKSLKCQVQVTKANVAEKVSGKQHRGVVELAWVVFGVMAIHWLKTYTILLDVELLHVFIRAIYGN